MRRRLLGIGLGAAVVCSGTVAAARQTPWWREQRMVFMWCQWVHAYRGDPRQLPRERFRDIAQAGATVFVEGHGAEIFPDHARFAHEFGLRYFASVFISNLMDTHSVPWVRTWNGRRAVTKTGEPSPPNRPWCPLHEPTYRKLLVEPHLELARAGLLDGIHIDWEEYGGKIDDKQYDTRGCADICYGDDCFARFLARRNLDGPLPVAAERFAWLDRKGLVEAYEENFHQRRETMFRRLAQELRAHNPDLLFAVYYGPGEINDFSRAVHTPKTPFICLDQKHYNSDDRMPWWESYGARLRQEGYLYVPCALYETAFNAQGTVQVGAARWLYEAAINEDGVVIWYGREKDDEILRTYGSATRRLKAVERKVGKYLLNGRRDYDFVSTVEWTGRPELERAIVARSYHRDGSHLVHLNNVNSEWPLRIRVRFPRLAPARRWTVRDPLGDLCYSHDGDSTVWTTEQLRTGVVVPMEPRSDMFLLVSRARWPRWRTPWPRLDSQEYSMLPEHGVASNGAGPAETIGDAAAPPGNGSAEQLLYTATEPMGFGGYSGLMTIGNAIRTVSAGGDNVAQLRQLRGHLWAPRYAANGNRIAFVHDAGGRGQVYVMNADGSEPTNLSNNNFCDRSPVWSPDGSMIAFLSDRTGDWDIHVMAADGSRPRRLSFNPGPDRAPAWSPDGTRVAWESQVSGTPTVWVGAADGQHSRPLIAPDQPFRVQGIKAGKAVDLENRGFARTTVFPDNTFYLMNPVWSPDGTRIAANGLIGSHFRVVVIDADGSRMLTVASYGYSDLAWSPDGRQLVVARSATTYENLTGIFLIDADGTGNQRWLVQAKPVGPRMAETVGHPSIRHSWYSHGSARLRMVAKSFCSLSWSPDGTSLAFSSDMDPTGAFYVYTIRRDGGAPVRLDATRSAWPQRVMWQP